MGWISFDDKEPPDDRPYLAGYIVTVDSTTPERHGKREWSCEVVDAGDSPASDDYTHWLAIPAPKRDSK
jgi:hypothetical protein